jgi:hypothetical protein
VVSGVAGLVVAMLAAVHASRVDERALQRRRRRVREKPARKTDHLGGYRGGVGGADGVGYVVVATTHRRAFAPGSIGIGFADRSEVFHSVTDTPLTEEEKAQIRQRLQALEVEHHDLDDVIDKLVVDPGQDRLQLQRLKKRKLLLKDQIQRLRARLIPDIIA